MALNYDASNPAIAALAATDLGILDAVRATRYAATGMRCELATYLDLAMLADEGAQRAYLEIWGTEYVSVSDLDEDCVPLTGVLAEGTDRYTRSLECTR